MFPRGTWFSIVLAVVRSWRSAKEMHVVTLDLMEQLAGFDKSGQFVVTPPVHTLMAFQQALRE